MDTKRNAANDAKFNSDIRAGRILKAARNIRELTQVEVGLLWGCSDKTIHRMENDQSPIDYNQLMDMLDRLNLKLEDVKNVA